MARVIASEARPRAAFRPGRVAWGAWTVVAAALVYAAGGAGVVALLMTAAVLVAVAQQTLP
ncbi:MAG TPA: hypothetical protein VHN37_14070 [Actinomycetota bacterium]|nr:hypothetical protein [Actinomycetota bacterium]